jgi:hypothetical protein
MHKKLYPIEIIVIVLKICFLNVVNFILTGLERLRESPCPVFGEYTGVIPDATDLCAKLSSDCKSREIMYYTVSVCSQSEIYEGERDCLCIPEN